MNLQEARSILGVSEKSTPDEIKKKYRELTKKYHPDVNKEAGADDKFKKINEAYSYVTNGEPESISLNDYSDNMPYDIFSHNDLFNNMRGNRRTVIAENIASSTKISFKESVLGCKKDLSINRKIKCSNCNGEGRYKLHNGCNKCAGTGVFVRQNKNMIMSQTCDQCYGRVKFDKCNNCNATGMLDSSSSIQVTIPGGIVNNSILRLRGIGNFVGTGFLNSEQYTDVLLTVFVESDPDLTLEGSSVVSQVNLSLLEALQGCTKTVRTVFGEKDVTINPKSKHNESINLPNLGVNRIGNQVVILNVQYPDDIESLINTLKKNNK